MTSSSPYSTMDCVDALRYDGVDAVVEALGGGAESLFPLRQFAEFDARKHPTRASQQAARDRQLKVVRANEAIDALNLLHGSAGVADSTPVSPAQKSALKHIWRSISAAPLDPAISESRPRAPESGEDL